MKIQVKKHHIRNGKCSIPSMCMVSLAIKEACPEISHASVTYKSILLSYGRANEYEVYPASVRISTPPGLAETMRAWDSGRKITPFTVDLPIPPTTPASTQLQLLLLQNTLSEVLNNG